MPTFIENKIKEEFNRDWASDDSPHLRRYALTKIHEALQAQKKAMVERVASLKKEKRPPTVLDDGIIHHPFQYDQHNAALDEAISSLTEEQN